MRIAIDEMKTIKKVILVLIVLVIVAALVSLPFLNEAQRMIVAMGAGLGVLNLLGLLFFLNKNSKSPQR
jgi:hypothetical protein